MVSCVFCNASDEGHASSFTRNAHFFDCHCVDCSICNVCWNAYNKRACPRCHSFESSVKPRHVRYMALAFILQTCMFAVLVFLGTPRDDAVRGFALTVLTVLAVDLIASAPFLCKPIWCFVRTASNSRGIAFSAFWISTRVVMIYASASGAYASEPQTAVVVFSSVCAIALVSLVFATYNLIFNECHRA